jgi:hypothetical protein
MHTRNSRGDGYYTLRTFFEYVLKKANAKGGALKNNKACIITHEGYNKNSSALD